MKLNSHSTLSSFYRYFYLTDSMPNNLCNYFWSLIFAFICMPFVWPALLINRYSEAVYLVNDKEYGDYYRVKYSKLPTAVGMLVSVAIILFGGLARGILLQFFKMDIVHPGFEHTFIDICSLLLAGIIFALLILGTLIVLAKTVVLIWVTIEKMIPKKEPIIETWQEEDSRLEKEYQERQAKEKYQRENPGFFKICWNMIIAFKEKNCPLITWDSKK